MKTTSIQAVLSGRVAVLSPFKAGQIYPTIINAQGGALSMLPVQSAMNSTQIINGVAYNKPLKKILIAQRYSTSEYFSEKSIEINEEIGYSEGGYSSIYANTSGNIYRNSIAYSADGMYRVTAYANNAVQIMKWDSVLSSWNSYPITGFTPASYNSVVISADSKKLVAVSSSTISIIDLTSGTTDFTAATLATLGTNFYNGGSVAISSDGAMVVFASDVTNVSYKLSPIISAVDGSVITTLLGGIHALGIYALKFSPDDTMLVAAHKKDAVGNAITIYSTADGSVIEQVKADVNAISIAWVTGNELLVGLDTHSESLRHIILKLDGTLKDQLKVALPIPNCGTIEIHDLDEIYQINGTIEESLAASEWTVTARDYETGSVVNKKTVAGNTFNLTFSTNRMVYITVDTYQGEIWTLDTVVSVGDKVIPTSPIDVPYYFICTTGGQTGSTEPVWDTTLAGQTADGQVVWDRVERLIQPVTQGPLRPTIIV